MKRGLVVLTISMLLVLPLATAGFFDWFKDKTQLAPANVSLTMTNSQPTILNWTEPDSNTATGPIDAWGPTLCSTTTVQTAAGTRGVDVWIEDVDGDDDLNGGAAVEMDVTEGGTTRTAICSRDVTTIDGDNFALFNCPFDMQFYDAADPEWDIKVNATDDAGSVANNDNVVSDGGSNYPYFQYAQWAEITVDDDNAAAPEGTIAFSGISQTTTNRGADDNLEITNCGNVNIDSSSTYLEITGKNMTSSTDPVANTHKIVPDSFSAHQSSTALACSAGQALPDDLTDINLNNFILATGASATSNAFFCLTDINPNSGPDPITVDGYETNSTNFWEVDICTASCS